MHLFFCRCWRALRDESGQTLLLFTILLPVLCGFAALAIDIGILRYQKEQLQSAADAAAIAGALEISYCGGTSNCAVMQAAALQSMSENGYSNVTLNTQCTGTNSATGITLTLNNGPCELGSTANDPNYGSTSSVEAVVAKEEPTYFGRILGIKQTLLSARAEATQGDSPYCIYVAAQPAGSPQLNLSQAVNINSGGHLTASCGLMDDSNSTTALLADNGAHVQTTENSVVGGVLLNGNGNSVHVDPTPTTNAPALPDPLSYLKPPNNPGGCTSLTNGKGGSISSGCYSGININSGNSLTLGPGVYYLTGGINVGSGASISGTGVTLYFASGALQMNSGSNLNLVAPTTGPYAGIAYYQDPADTTQIIYDGGSKSALQGALYAPDAQLVINSGGNVAAYTIIDVQSMILNSGAKLSLGNDYSSLPGGSPAKGVTAGLSE